MKTRIVLLGPPASGKGTQAGMIKARYGIPTASPGAMLREESRKGTPLGIEAARLTDGGGMAPDTMVVELVRQWIGAHSGAFVFDGFPRTLAQAEALDAMLAAHGSALDGVLFFDMGVETIFQRVMNRLTCSQCGHSVAIGLHVKAGESRCPLCGGALIRRSDDTPGALEMRLREYQEKTEPLVAYYQARGLLWPLQSAELPEKVFSEIATIMEAA